MNQEELNFTVSVPGKVILIGEHSVVYKKRGLAASISKRTFLHFREHKEAHEQITFTYKSLLERVEWDFKSVYNVINLNKPLTCDMKDFSLSTPEYFDHDKYVELIKEFVLQKVPEDGPKQKAMLGTFYAVLGMLWCTDIDISPFDLEVYSDVALGAGTGSSAAFSVCIASAVYNYIRLKAYQKFGSGEFNVSSNSFKAHTMELAQHYNGFSLKDKDIVNKWAFCLEKINHSTPSGIDNSVCTYGNAILLNAIGEKDEKSSIDFLDNLPSFRILLVNSGVPRSTADMAKKVSTLLKICPEATQSILDSMDIIAMKFLEHAQEIKNESDKADVLQHYRKLEVLIDLQHGHLRTLGVSHPRLEEICFITKRRGLHSKLTGAGGGGNAFTLLPPDATEEDIKETVQDLKSSGFLVDDIVLNGEGLTLESN
ncbi:mevalonate kinase [Halyomorpha halys]|uniref:mevalonate kinase n=1 Tax=Halyomorpha halys TaxID=286706 RepID=UPI0006D4E633|nr:mevalonate kinase [Halyomorpha halys]